MVEKESSQSLILLGKSEVAVSSFLLVASLIMIFSDLTFHLAGGFLAVIGLGVGLPSLVGLVAGWAILKSPFLGAVLNLILACIIINFELPVITTALSDLMAHGSLDYRYPLWHFVGAVIFLSIAAFLIVFFLRLLLKKWLTKN